MCDKTNNVSEEPVMLSFHSIFVTIHFSNTQYSQFSGKNIYVVKRQLIKTWKDIYLSYLQFYYLNGIAGDLNLGYQYKLISYKGVDN